MHPNSICVDLFHGWSLSQTLTVPESRIPEFTSKAQMDEFLKIILRHISHHLAFCNDASGHVLNFREAEVPALLRITGRGGASTRADCVFDSQTLCLQGRPCPTTSRVHSKFKGKSNHFLHWDFY